MGRYRPYKARKYTVGQQLLLLRTRSGLTQEQLAGLIGVHRRSVQNWETGAAYPHADGLRRLIALYLHRDSFTDGQEADEAEALWEQVREDAPRPIAPFDAAWFAGLRARPAAEPPSPQPGGEVSIQARQAGSPGPAWIEAILAAHDPIASERPAHAAPAHQPPAAQAAPVPHNLPATLTAIIGRTAEVAMITRFLADPAQRLITLVGVGGVGKTRLALDLAWGVAGGQAETPFLSGVYFVPLADMRLPAGDAAQRADALATTIAVAMRFALSGAERPYQQVINYLYAQRLLLILDNLEHLPELTPAIVGMLQQVPALTILATSRARLDVRGEQVVPLDGLPYPPLRGQPQPSASYAALQLFQHSAASHAPHLKWGPEALAAAAEICARVEGLPLAIELAASLVRLLSIHEIAAELVAGSAGLYAAQHDLPARHRSLQAVFDHSWRLLAPREQQVLRELTIFRGGFDRHAAQAVAGASLPSLAALINHSLLRESAPAGTTARYSMHELVRQYGADELRARDPGEQAGVHARHSRYYLGWAAARYARLRGDEQQAAQQELHREIDNIRAAWHWAAAHDDLPAIVEAGKALFHFYEMRSWFQEGADLFRLAAERCDRLAAGAPDRATAVAWAQMLARQGWLTFHLGQQELAGALLAQSLALLEPLDAPGELGFTLNYLSAVTYHSGDYDRARQLAQRALSTSLAVGDQHGTAIAQTIIGQIAYLVGAYDEARRWSLESLALEQRLGNRWGSVFTLISLGRVAVALDDYAEAGRWFEQGLAIRYALGDGRGIGLCLIDLGDVAAAMGEHFEAERRYRASLAHFRLIHNGAGVASALTRLGSVALATQDRQAARRMTADALRVAWAMRALPQTLAALAGFASLLADERPRLAAEIAALVVAHPAATQGSRRQALAARRLVAGDAAPQPDPAGGDLAALVAQLLE